MVFIVVVAPLESTISGPAICVSPLLLGGYRFGALMVLAAAGDKGRFRT